MFTAYRNALARYATFAGRSSRSQFWFYNLAVIVLLIVCAVIDIGVFGSTPETGMVLTGLANLVHLIPSLALTVRRMHDTDRSGWTLLLMFIPIIGQVALFVFACMPSTVGPNRFGTEPGWGDDALDTQSTRSRASQVPVHAFGREWASGTRSAEPVAERSFTGPAPRTPSAAGSGSLVAELRELADLKAQGALDETEFQRLKAELMTRRSDKA